MNSVERHNLGVDPLKSIYKLDNATTVKITAVLWRTAPL